MASDISEGESIGHLVLRIAKKINKHNFSDDFLIGLCELGEKHQFDVDQTELRKNIILHLQKEGYTVK
jgi:hypothetical protein